MSQPISQTFNQDCLEAMRGMADNAFDLAIVDPPYGINVEKFSFGNGNKGRKVDYATANKFKDWDKQPPADDYFKELFRVSKNQIIFGGNYFNLPPTRCFYFWFKGNSMKGRDYADGELIWTSFDRVARMFEYNPTHGGKKTKIHPCQKSVAIYARLLNDFAKQGDRILDTHLGSGSSRIAAYNLGFDFTGFELDADYFAAQEKRFNEHLKQPKLFEPTVQTVQQGDLFL